MIVVIGILAAITIVAYNGLQSRSSDAAIISDLNAAYKKLEIYRADNGAYPIGNEAGLTGSPPDTSAQQLKNADMHFSKGSYLTSINNVGYCVVNASSDTGRVAIGAVGKSGKLLYVSTQGGGTTQYYTGAPVDNTTPIADLCSLLLQQPPDTVSRGFLNGSWLPWTN